MKESGNLLPLYNIVAISSDFRFSGLCNKVAITSYFWKKMAISYHSLIKWKLVATFKFHKLQQSGYN